MEVSFLKELLHFFPRRPPSGNVKLQTLYSPQTKTCTLSIAKNNPGKVWRYHLFSSNGQYMIFNNYGSGPVSKDTGARSYWLFPRKKWPTFRQLSHTVLIDLPQQSQIEFDKMTVKISNSHGINVTEAIDINRFNKGGIEINRHKGLLLDNGFTLGRAPYSLPNEKSFFYDHLNNSCEVTNKEIFRYVYSRDDSGQIFLQEVFFLFDLEINSDQPKTLGDQRLYKFLKLRCPQLNLFSLENFIN